MDRNAAPPSVGSSTPGRLDRSRFAVEVEDDFEGPALDERIWLPFYLPQWSSRAATAARYEIRDSVLRLRIDADQAPWSQEFDGWTRVSSLQTGVSSGPVGSPIGQLRFREGLVVREVQPAEWWYTPRYGLVEARLRVPADPSAMAALWMIGIEDEPEHSGEICIAEVFGRNIADGAARVGIGVHPFGDPRLTDDFVEVTMPIDPTTFHVYSAAWTPDGVAFYIDEVLVRVVDQSPDYPMQVMLGLYEFADGPGPVSPPDAYPKVFEVDWFRGHRLRDG